MKTRIVHLLSVTISLSLILAAVPSAAGRDADRSQESEPGNGTLFTGALTGTSRPAQDSRDSGSSLGASSIRASETGSAGSTSSAAVQTDAENVEFVGHMGGKSMAVAVQGDYAYVGEGPRLTVLDISDPATPVVAAKTALFPDIVADVYIGGTVAYVADGYGGLRLVDVSDPLHPSELGSYQTRGKAVDVHVKGEIAYVAGDDAGLQVVDVSDPWALSEVGFYDTADSALGLTVAGNYAYVADGLTGLQVVDISDPAAPSPVGACNTPQVAQDVAIVESYAYVADGAGGLRVVDISDPAAPREVGCSDTLAYVKAVAVAEGHAFVGSANGLRVVDISDPAAPREVGFYDLPGGGSDVAVSGDHAYVTGQSSLRVMDVSAPSRPSEVGFYYTPGYTCSALAVAGGHAYVADEAFLRVVDISDPAAPKAVGFYSAPQSAMDVVVAESYAYVADTVGGLRVVDISDPAAPREVGFCHARGDARRVSVATENAYVVDSDNGLQVVDISDPAAPREVGFYDLPGGGSDVAVSGDYAYVADGQGDLRVVDVSDPAHPSEIGYWDTPGIGWRVTVEGRFAYVLEGRSGALRIVDVSDPTAPSEVGSCTTDALAYDVAVEDRHAYVVSDGYGGYGGLSVVDVSDPTAPSEVGFYHTRYGGRSIAVRGSYVYLADPVTGLTSLRYTGIEYSVSGQVKDTNGDPISGVVVSAGEHGSTTTDANGIYAISSLIAGTYTLTPTKSGWTFTPPTRTVSVPPDAKGQDFAGSAVPAGVDLSIGEVTPIQVLEGQPLVAGKDTAVKVIVNKSGSESVSNVQARLVYGTDELSSFYVREEDNWDGLFRLEEANTAYPLDFSATETTKTIYFFDNALTPSDVGAYDVMAEVDPLNLVSETDELNNVATSATGVYEAVWGRPDHPELDLRYVPVAQSRSPALIDFVDSQTRFIETVYPVATDNLRYGVNALRSFRWPSLPYQPDYRGLVDLASAVWLVGKVGDWTADQIVGITPDGWLYSEFPDAIPSTVKGMHLGGVALVEMSSAVGATAHEVGHLYGLWTPCEQYDRDCDGTWDNLGNPVLGGLRVSDRTVMNDGDTKGTTRHGVYSFMGTANYDPPTVDRLVDAGDYQALATRSGATSEAIQTLSAEDGILLVTGIVGKDNSAEFLDWYHMLDGSHDQIEPGPYALRALDGQGTVLHEQPFTMTFTLMGAITPTLEEAPFAFAMPFVSGTSEFELQHEGQTLITRTVSAHTPTVTIVSPNGGEILTDSVTVEWMADDADGDMPRCAVLLSPDNGTTWSTAAVGLTETVQSVDISALPPGTDNLVKVIATDGVNTGQDTSDAPFTIRGEVYLPLVLRQ